MVGMRPHRAGWSRIHTALLLPWIKLDRATGWKRRGLMALYTVILGAGLVFGWRSLCLTGLPDIDDPFDLQAFMAYHVPAAQDAFTIYEHAGALYHPSDVAIEDPARIWSSVGSGWARAGPELQSWVEQNRDALAVWQRGTERMRAMAIAPHELRPNRGQPLPANRWRDFAWMALLEGSRLEEAGDPAAAWK